MTLPLRGYPPALPVGLQGLTTTTILGGRGPASSARSQASEGRSVSGSTSPYTTRSAEPVICSNVDDQAY